MMAAKLEEKQHLLGIGGVPQWENSGKRGYKANLMACFEQTGSTSRGLFLSKSITSEAFDPQMVVVGGILSIGFWFSESRTACQQSSPSPGKHSQGTPCTKEQQKIGRCTHFPPGGAFL